MGRGRREEKGFMRPKLGFMCQDRDKLMQAENIRRQEVRAQPTANATGLEQSLAFRWTRHGNRVLLIFTRSQGSESPS